MINSNIPSLFSYFTTLQRWKFIFIAIIFVASFAVAHTVFLLHFIFFSRKIHKYAAESSSHGKSLAQRGGNERQRMSEKKVQIMLSLLHISFRIKKHERKSRKDFSIFLDLFFSAFLSLRVVLGKILFLRWHENRKGNYCLEKHSTADERATARKREWGMCERLSYHNKKIYNRSFPIKSNNCFMCNFTYFPSTCWLGTAEGRNGHAKRARLMAPTFTISCGTKGICQKTTTERRFEVFKSRESLMSWTFIIFHFSCKLSFFLLQSYFWGFLIVPLNRLIIIIRSQISSSAYTSWTRTGFHDPSHREPTSSAKGRNEILNNFTSTLESPWSKRYEISLTHMRREKEK